VGPIPCEAYSLIWLALEFPFGQFSTRGAKCPDINEGPCIGQATRKLSPVTSCRIPLPGRSKFSDFDVAETVEM
jgi:hypothetical protein